MLVERPGFWGLAGSSVGGGARLLELARLPVVCADKLSIHFRLRLNPMACLRLVGHKLYIRLRLVAISDGVLEAGRPQTLHPITPSAISDGMLNDGVLEAGRLETLHPITPSAISDGMFKACRAQTLHPITASAGSDGMSAQKRSNSLHPITASATSDGVPVHKHPNSLHPSTHSAKSDGTPAIYNKKLPAPGTPGPEARLLTISHKLICYFRSIPQFSKASVISPCAMTLLSPRTTVPLAAASSNIST